MLVAYAQDVDYFLQIWMFEDIIKLVRLLDWHDSWMLFDLLIIGMPAE
jgi:hypothetical protein